MFAALTAPRHTTSGMLTPCQPFPFGHYQILLEIVQHTMVLLQDGVDVQEAGDAGQGTEEKQAAPQQAADSTARSVQVRDRAYHHCHPHPGMA